MRIFSGGANESTIRRSDPDLRMGLDQEEGIVCGLAAGETLAWNTLYESYFERVWATAARLIGPRRDEVGDVVQETFLAAARSARTYDAERGSLWSWLSSILRREVANHYRKRYRENRVAPGGDMAEDVTAQISDWLERRAPMPDEKLLVAEVADAVRETLARLPADYQTLLVARYRDEMDVEQIASEHDSSVSAIRSKLARARKAFREVFGTEPVNESGRSCNSAVPYEEMEVPK